MNRVGPIRALPLAAIGVAATVAYAAVAFFAPRSAAPGLLVSFLFWSGIAVGGLAALMIHRLTGGNWGYANARAFELAVGALPLVAVFAIVIFALLPALYPWSSAPAAAPDVMRWYLNSPLFIVRTCIAFAGWIVIAVALRLPGPVGQLIAASGLVFHGLIVGVIGLDWIQSVEPPFFSSSFGASLAFTQLLAAFAFAAILSPPDERDCSRADLGGLMLTMVLGLTYIDFMAFLIVWYGNLPHKVEWFVRREALPWSAIAIAMFVLTSVVPVFLLFFARVRASRSGLRAVGCVILAGIALYDIWLVAPAGGPASALTALFAIAAAGALLSMLAAAGLPSTLWPRLGAAHD